MCCSWEAVRITVENGADGADGAVGTGGVGLDASKTDLRGPRVGVPPARIRELGGGREQTGSAEPPNLGLPNLRPASTRSRRPVGNEPTPVPDALSVKSFPAPLRAA
ncbi:hypothetical protein Sgleb_53770 [Streptomyces glebosus]|uniref:Uncharacterized protein n=1 Tax=Streptomyces glebosus TaxID=249580 RepID=A0A640T2E3_9ACTN|nr:hypothetical protein Sgleb_53770 [Streptomyces glebosus]